MKNNQDPQLLYKQYINNELNAEEIKALFNTLGNISAEHLQTITGEVIFAEAELSESDEEEKDRLQQILLNIKDTCIQDTLVYTIRRKLYYKISAAAAVLLVLGLSLYLFKAGPVIPKTLANADVQPASNKATLTLSNGSHILLTDVSTGKVAAEQGVIIRKSKEGLLSYDDQTAAATPVFNTLKTPRGGRYSLSLPDGTKVLLNAASSLTFPTVFNGKIRSVKLQGEAYFEVAKDAAHPFIVEVGRAKVKVLGTIFNIDAYRSVETTLQEGSVLMSASIDSTRLVPGEQAKLLPSGKLVKKTVDADVYTGWVRNELIFDEDTDLQQAMDRLGREYDYLIGFSDPKLGSIKISGNLDKYANLNTVLDYITKITNLKFNINPEKRTVMVDR